MIKYGVLIAGAAAALLLFGGCEKKESESPMHEKAPAVKSEAAPEPAKAPEAAAAASEEAVNVAEETKADSREQKTQTPIVEKVEESVAEVKEKASEITESVKEEAAAAVAAVSESVSKPKTDEAQSLYKSKCAGCHGTKGEKHALGKSNLIAGESKALLVQKIKGYKDGTFGGAMKSIMTSQVKSLSDAQIEELAEYISTLK